MIPRCSKKARVAGWGALCALLALPAGLDAQQTYRMEGTVVDATTQQPLANVSVVLVGTQIGTITNASGRYQLAARVQPGSYVVEYSIIGRESVTQTVQLGNSLTVEVPQVALREANATEAPASASPCVRANPIPRLPPVTNALLPVRANVSSTRVMTGA